MYCLETKLSIHKHKGRQDKAIFQILKPDALYCFAYIPNPNNHTEIFFHQNQNVHTLEMSQHFSIIMTKDIVIHILSHPILLQTMSTSSPCQNKSI